LRAALLLLYIFFLLKIKKKEGLRYSSTITRLDKQIRNE
jgi:hypothetical protein